METAEVLGPLVPVSPCDHLNNQENVDSPIRLIVDSITGSRSVETVSCFSTVSSLKCFLAKKMNMSSDKFTLLYRDW